MEQSTSIDYLVEIGELSVRAGNVCKNAQLFTLSDLFRFFENERTFKNIRNCGNLTEIELQEYCYINQYESDDSSELVDIPLVQLTNIESISNKSRNLCLANNLNSLGEILHHFETNQSFKNLYSCGNKSDAELRQICLRYINNGWWAKLKDQFLSTTNTEHTPDETDTLSFEVDIFNKEVKGYHQTRQNDPTLLDC